MKRSDLNKLVRETILKEGWIENDFIKNVLEIVKDYAVKYDVAGSHVKVDHVLGVIRSALLANRNKLFE